ncbi:zinc finger protein Xfin-like [Ornithodoros turicata]|uniref:zinc finger protein Xfin-like n=1 Tax=Ornithodoros turicata TaxID=34597 RepID=UPI0031397028
MSYLANAYSLKSRLVLLKTLCSSKLPKSAETFATQVEPKNAMHFFKCMESACDFTTNDSDLFLGHLSGHRGTSFMCCYCRKVVHEDVQLVQHMVAHHNDRTFQCALCFFRSRTKAHLIVHSRTVHKTDTVHGYLCKRVAEIPAKDWPADIASKSYVCTVDESCKLSCLSTDTFLKHLRKKHPNASRLVCHKCMSPGKHPKGLVSHYRRVHNFKFYQCAYCSVGSDDEWVLMAHVSQAHSDYRFKIIIRTTGPPPWFKQVSTIMRESMLVAPPGSGGTQQPHAELTVKEEPLWDPPAHLVDQPGDSFVSAQETFSYIPACYICSVEDCAYSSNSAATFLGHIHEEHKSVEEFSCPCCSFLPQASSRELFVHLVDSHTALLHCPYRSCVFLGDSRKTVDDHIISVHQTYDDEPEYPDESTPDCNNVPQEASSSVQFPVGTEYPIVKHEKVEQQERENVDIVPWQTTAGDDAAPGPWLSEAELGRIAEEILRGQTVGAVALAEPMQQDDNVPEAPPPLPATIHERYACKVCRQSETEALEYFRHMSLHHGVKFFCGHCDGCYKVRRHLRAHHLRFHPREEVSFKTLQGNTLMDVPLRMTSAQQQGVANRKKKGRNGAAQEDRVPKDASTAVGTLRTTQGKKRPSTELGSERPMKRRAAKTLLSNVKHETAEEGPLPTGVEELPKQVGTDGINVGAATMCSGAGNRPGGSKRRKGKLASPRCLNTGNQSSEMPRSPQGPASKTFHNVSCRETPRSAVKAKSKKKPSTRCNVGNKRYAPPWGIVSYECIYCDKSYKLLKWALRHQKAAHPGDPSTVKVLEASTFGNSTAETQSLGQLLTQDIESSALPSLASEDKALVPSLIRNEDKIAESAAGAEDKVLVPSLIRNEDKIAESAAGAKDKVLVPSLIRNEDKIAESAAGAEDKLLVPSLIRNRDKVSEPAAGCTETDDSVLWHNENESTPGQAYAIISPDHSDDEAQQKGSSSHGVKANPLPTDIFVYMHREGVKIAYSQLATVMDMQPVVLLTRF